MFFITIYCPTCNRSSDEARFIGNFCEFCIIDRIKKTVPDRAKIYRCRFCKRIRVGNTYMEESGESLGRAIVIALNLKKCNAKAVLHTEKEANVRFNCEVDDSGVEFSKKLGMKIENKPCQQCYRMRSGYYEALVQIRGEEEKADDLYKKLAAFIVGSGGFISRIREINKGYDVFVSDKDLAARFLSMHRLNPTKSFQLYGLKRGRKVYRNIYAVRL